MSLIGLRCQVNALFESMDSQDFRKEKSGEFMDEIISIMTNYPSLRSDSSIVGRIKNLPPNIGSEFIQRVVAIANPLSKEISKGISECKVGEKEWETLKKKAQDNRDWDAVKFNLENIPELPLNLDEILRSDCPYFEGKKVFQTHKLVLMPSGLSINKQVKLMSYLRDGQYDTVYNFITSRFVEEKGSERIEKPAWVLVTKDVIPDSRDKVFEEQKKLLKEGYEVPTVLDVITLCMMHLEKSGEDKKCIFSSENPRTWSRCHETFEDGQMTVRIYIEKGLHVDTYSDKKNESLGLIALRKLHTA